MKSRLFQILPTLLVFFLLCGCHFTRLTEFGENESQVYQKIIKTAPPHYVIVHVNGQEFQLDQIEIDKEKISAHLVTPDRGVMRYYNKAPGAVPARDIVYIYQIHLHIDQATELALDTLSPRVTFLLSEFDSIEVMDYNQGMSVLATSGVVAGSILGGFGIFLAIVCNCPHVYVHDGAHYSYNNTLFTGATSPILERSDYKVMPDYVPNSSEYQFQIRNEDHEIQYINQLELIVAEHPEGVQVLADQSGGLYSISKPISAKSITDDGESDLTQTLKTQDGEAYLFNNEQSTEFSNVYAKFQSPGQSSKAKIVVSARNTKWGSVVYNEFSSLFGEKYEKWVSKNHNKSLDKVRSSMKKAGIPMVVSIKQGSEWVDLESIDLIGDVSFNSLVIPVDGAYLTEGEIEIRIQSGFAFWALDHVAMDFSENELGKVSYLKPKAALSNNMKDFKNALLDDDEQYTSQEEHEQIDISFTGLPKGINRTVILHSKGYYLPQKKYDGKPRYGELVKFKQKGSLSIFSKQLYQMYEADLFLGHL